LKDIYFVFLSVHFINEVATTTTTTTPSPTCRTYSFQCDNGKCIHKDWKCDGIEDCSGGSDESNCPCTYKYIQGDPI